MTMKSKQWMSAAILALALGAVGCGSDKKEEEEECGGCTSEQPFCDTSTGRCVSCLEDYNCSAPTPKCRQTDHICVECITKSDCVAGETCQLGSCVSDQQPEPECSETKPCTEGKCDLEAQVCIFDVQCTKETEATDCPKDGECKADGTCLNSKKVYCSDANTPANATASLEMVSIAWTATSGWTKAKDCGWNCNGGFEPTADGKGCTKAPDCTPENQATTCPGSVCVNGSCQTSKKVDCKSVDHGAHSTNIVTQVTITWSSSTGTWTEPAVCEWKCDTGSSGNWVKDGDVCVKAPDCTPDNQATTCPNGGQCGSSGSCITSKSVPCDSTGTPAHATARQENVTITWTADTGWTSAAACHWDCNSNENYVLNDTRDGCKLNENPACTPGTCTSNKYCQIDGTEWDCRQEHCEANPSDPAMGGCFECTQASHCGNENDYYCNSNHSCSQYICNSHHSCTGAHQTCDTSAVGGACVMASCTGTVCTDDGYICLGGKYSPCAHGCNSDGTCKSALTGCAAQANPDDWCLEHSNDGVVCDVSSGNCVECIIDSNPAHNTCSASQTCTNNHCVNNCGNQKLDSDEDCDPSIPSTQWAEGYRSCTANSLPPYYVLVGEITCSSTCEVEYGCTTCGNGMMDEGEDCDPTVNSSQWEYSSCSDLGPRWSGTFSCGSDCKANIDGCIEGPADPCDSVQADEECTSYNNGHPQPCDVYFFGDEGVSTTASIVCKPASATCSSKLVIDDEKTLEVCFPTVNKVAVDWCRTQSHSGGYILSLNSTTPNLTLYGQVNINGVTGSNNSGNAANANIQGELIYWDEELNEGKITGTKSSELFGGSDVNDQWSVTLTPNSFPANGTYSYAWRFRADDKSDWYYCRTEKQNNGSGGATMDSADILAGDYLVEGNAATITVTKTSATTYTQNFAASKKLTSSYAAATETLDGFEWNWANARNKTESKSGDVTYYYDIDGAGMIFKNVTDAYVQLKSTAGIGSFSFQWRPAYTGAGNRQVKVSTSTNGTTWTDVWTSSAVANDLTSTALQTPSININTTGTVYVRVSNVLAKQVLLGNFNWTDYL